MMILKDKFLNATPKPNVNTVQWNWRPGLLKQYNLLLKFALPLLLIPSPPAKSKNQASSYTSLF